MEAKKDIYHLWVQYTTKNDEQFFRQFIKGFVTIWESQLNLNWNYPVHWKEVKHDAGPSLSRLPEELLPAISKFVFIAQDQVSCNQITEEGLQQIDLLIRCLIIICRNFDNIPLVASCDYVGHAVTIATIIIQKLVDEATNLGQYGVSFIFSICHLLECLYDPYLSWRHFLNSNIVDISQLLFQPALLHVEVIPFIYGCFETNLVDMYPELSCELLHVLGAIISGAQHNSLRAVCPATVKLVMTIISKGTAPENVHTAALNCFIMMIRVLAKSAPDQRQIEISTLVTLYNSAVVSAFDHLAQHSASSQQILRKMMIAYRSLIEGKVSRSFLLENQALDTICKFLERCKEFESDNQELAAECVNTFSFIIQGNPEVQQKIKQSGLFGKFIKNIEDLGVPSRHLLINMLNMVCEEELGDCITKDITIRNPDALLAVAGWLGKVDVDNQLWLTNILNHLCTCNLQSKILSCSVGLFAVICDVLKSETSIHFQTLYVLLELLQSLALHSITSYELKQLFLLLRNDSEDKAFLKSGLIRALCAISRKNDTLECKSYFDIQSEEDSIIVSNIQKWPAAGYGFTFYAWVRLDSKDNSASEFPNNESYRRQLFSITTAIGTGMQIFFRADGTVVIGVTTKKEFLTACASDHPLLDEHWHCLVVTFTAARRHFGHDQVSIFIDGTQRLTVSIKFPSLTDSFVSCTIGSVAQSRVTMNHTMDKSTEKAQLLPGMLGSSIIPNIINFVPSHFTLPLRSSTPLDSHVKSFPVGLQDSVWGTPTCLFGQIGVVALFHETLSISQVKTLYESGPNLKFLFEREELEMSELTSKLVFCYTALACHNNFCLDLSPSGKYPAQIKSKHIRTFNMKDSINGIGGLSVLLPLLENAKKNETVTSFHFNSPTTEQDALDDWEILPQVSQSERKLEKNPVSAVLMLVKNLISSHKVNSKNVLKDEIVPIIGYLLSKLSPNVIDENVLLAIDLLIKSAKDLQEPALLRNIYQHILFHFKIWSECQYVIKMSHIQLISTIIKEDRKYLRKKYGVQFFLDTIRSYYTGLELLSNEDTRTIRHSLFGLIRFYIQKEISVKEVMPLLKFLITIKEEIVAMELLEMLISHMEKKSCRDQIFLLMYEPHSAELLYALLIDKEFSMDLKQKVLRFLSLLLRSERVYERHKTRLRLQDGSVIGNSNGMYLGLVSYLHEQVLTMEVVVMLMEQLLMTDANNNYAGALMLLNVLALADLDIKLEVAKKVLTTTFMKPQAPQLFAKQTAWQDSIARLLIKCPINVPEQEPDSAFPDLMTFDEEGMKDEPSLSLFTSTAMVLENKVTENINNAADNITSAVASVYSVFKQKTVEMQDTLEDAKSRITKRASLMSVSEGFSEMDSPLPSPHLQRKSKSDPFENSYDSSSNEDLSTPSPRVTNTTPSHRSLTFTEDENEIRTENSEEIENIDELLREWKALDAEKIGDKEEELCYLVVNILFTILWRGVEGYGKEAWKERGQVMACINLLALNNELYVSHLSLKLRILEMAVQASLSDLRDTSQNVTAHSENASQLMRWVYDLVVLDPNEDMEKKASVKLLDSILALLDALIVFQEPPAEEWVDMARLALGILLNCANSQNIEMCAMATAKLHSLLQTRSIKDMEEGGYMLFMVNKGITDTLQAENQERYSFLMPVVKTLLEKLSSAFYYNTVLTELPPLSSGPAFFENFKNYCKSDEWNVFIERKVRPLHDAYKSALQGQLIETMNIFWAECYESCKLSVAKRSREVAESRARFQSQVIVPFRMKQQEEISRYNNQLIQDKNRRLATRNTWRQRKRYLTGERGPWTSSDGEEQHWKLSHHENYSRMRLKLSPNMHFDSHVNASNLRDNTGWMSRMQSVEDMTLPLSLPIIMKNDSEDDVVPEDDFRLSLIPEFADFDGGKEKMMLSEECELVTLMSVVKGRMDITTSHIYFYDLSPVKDEVDRQDFKWPLFKLREVHLRQYNLRRSALEFFLIDQTNYFINFTKKNRNRVLSCIYSSKPPNLLYNGNRSPGEILRLSGLTQRWVNREISNFDYLMCLNTIAGRSYNDLSQYPVFPWILVDYTSEVLDLNDPATFRDLSKPIGVVNPKNEAEVRAKYDHFEDPTGTIAKFHYGTHYSNSAGVLHYLVRVEPFTSLHIELQSGRFDVADRQFHSIPQTWKLLMDNPNDVKELTPEFFYFPEFLKNLNKFDLGLLQGTKERVDDVILPKWASSAEDFIYKHRKALESEHVSLNLHHWIDLIFGCKQKGPKAVEALNVFYYCSYEGAVDLDSIKNPAEREAVEGMINNFGQTPRQLLKDFHPQRLSWEDALAKMIKNELRKPDLTLFLDNIRSFTVEVTNDKDPLIYISTPRSQPRGGFHLVDVADTIVSVTKAGVIGCHSWLPYDKHSFKSFVFDVDSSHTNTKTRKKVPDSFHPSISLNSHLFALSLDAKLLFTGGHWDSSLQVYSIPKNKVISTVISHSDLVTCLSLDQCGLFLITGSKDTTCVVWDVSHICVPNIQQSGLAPKPHQILYGHDSEVTCVSIMTELDVAVSGSKDGLVNVHTVENGQYIRALYPIDKGPGTEVTFLTLSAQGHIAFSCKDETKHSVHVFSINGTNLGSKYVAGQVTGLATAGDCLVIVDDGGDLTMNRLLGLHPIYDIPFHVPIQTAVVTIQSTHLIIPLRDGNVVVIGVPNS